MTSTAADQVPERTPVGAEVVDAPGVASPWRRAGRRMIRQPAGVIGGLLLLLFIVAAIAPSLLAPHDPLHAFTGEALKPPSGRFPFGTDPIGRDVLSRVIYGARPALLVGLASVAIGGAVGVLTGLAAGFFDNRPTNAVMRLWDGVFAVPAILIGLMLAATFGTGVTVVAVAVGIAAAPSLARVSRAASLAESHMGYVEAAEALGYRRRRVFWRHVVPNSLSTVIVQLALTMAFAILLESALAFLGVSTQPPAPSWGVMLSDSRTYLGQAWWYGLFPGLAITIVVLSVNLLADAARDALDPRSDAGS
ncbi:MAG: ABC transporter permease [Actinomycetota bacterium]|nr:ABC transporter permease [Actinomycetota bacterium]